MSTIIGPLVVNEHLLEHLDLALTNGSIMEAKRKFQDAWLAYCHYNEVLFKCLPKSQSGEPDNSAATHEQCLVHDIICDAVLSRLKFWRELVSTTRAQASY